MTPPEGSLPIRILVVEDEATTALLLREILEGEGFQVVGVDDGARAVEELERNPAFDLVIADVNMPEMDGLTLLSRIREEPAWEQIPVLICTARDDMETIREANRRGARGFIDKHITDRARLVARVRKVLEL